MSDLFGRRPFQTVVREVHAALGADCIHDELVESVKRTMTIAEYDAWSSPAFRAAVVKAAKSRGSRDGTDAVYESRGRVKALRLFSVEGTPRNRSHRSEGRARRRPGRSMTRRRSPLIRWLNCVCVVAALVLGAACQEAQDGEGCNEATNSECAP